MSEQSENFSSRVFIHNYPTSSRIEAHYQSNGRLYSSYYNIISLGTYPVNPKLTQRSRKDTRQYPIPDNYIVETEFSERNIRCETKYISNTKIYYTIRWKVNRSEWSVDSTKSSTAVANAFLEKIKWKNSAKLSGPRLFGFDIELLYNIRLQIVIPTTKVDKRKRLLEDITSRSQQNKRFNSFGSDVQKAVNQLIVKHKLTNSSGQPIVYIRCIELDYKENQIYVKFKDSNPATTQTRLDAVVRVCDEALLCRDGYQHLAAVVPFLFREYLVADRRNEINKLINTQIPIEIFSIDREINDLSNINDNLDDHTSDILVIDHHEIGNGAFRPLLTLLNVLIPIWKSGEKPIIKPGDTLYIKLGGDGRNVSRKQNHYLYFTYIILINPIVFSICLYIGKEKYETLANVGKIFSSQLAELKNNGIIDNNGDYWPIEFYFSGDWKFMYIIMGQNAPNSEYFCLYCECNAKSRNKRPPLFPVIDLFNYIPDELHILLRISDVLMECFFRDLFKRNDFERNFKEKIEKKMNELHIHFEFFHSGQGNWNWTSLMGPDKEILLQYFPVSEFISGSRGVDVENLWREFYRLYKILRKSSHTDEEILEFEKDAKNRVRTFCRPTVGQMNSAAATPGLYRKDDVTPYMHLKEKGFSLRLFSTCSVEKKNHEQVKLFFGGTTMGGGKKIKPVVYDILVFENRQIFYLINDIPNEITCNNINIQDNG
ncbi:hypothetical protein RhiirA1_469493 [Rhizophagus irregularis]|uniref:Uncharacterized protein n=1 Tax=Rhizophagus irregularis TaxID=588596 RepID=A0A2I1F3J7_9GLOM|nr:hypothetical protein RhiirA1_469493 [Rhizophagus irregularis]PKY28943.1 hypothetical protein RhiirB3_445349 [Rhizophagus irregularis]